MKLIKFRIKNYKSIIDSGDCYLTDNVTIFAGKNESGKTSILQALDDFDTDKKIRDDAKPIENKEAVPQVSITFRFSKAEAKEIFDKLGLERKTSDDITLEITKDYPNHYVITNQSLNDAGIIDSKKIESTTQEIEKSWEEIKGIHTKYPQLGGVIGDIDFKNIQNSKARLAQFKKIASGNINSISNETEKEKFLALLEETLKGLTELEHQSVSETHLLNLLKEEWIPYFILFSSFEDIFPNKIPLSGLETNEWIKD